MRASRGSMTSATVALAAPEASRTHATQLRSVARPSSGVPAAAPSVTIRYERRASATEAISSTGVVGRRDARVDAEEEADTGVCNHERHAAFGILSAAPSARWAREPWQAQRACTSRTLSLLSLLHHMILSDEILVI